MDRGKGLCCIPYLLGFVCRKKLFRVTVNLVCTHHMGPVIKCYASVKWKLYRRERNSALQPPPLPFFYFLLFFLNTLNICSEPVKKATSLTISQNCQRTCRLPKHKAMSCRATEVKENYRYMCMVKKKKKKNVWSFEILIALTSQVGVGLQRHGMLHH